MNEKIASLMAAIESESRQDAMEQISRELAENSAGLWAALKKRCGAKEASMVVMCLLIEAVEDGEILAKKHVQLAEDDDLSEIPLRMNVIDATGILFGESECFVLETAQL